MSAEIAAGSGQIREPFRVRQNTRKVKEKMADNCHFQRFQIFPNQPNY
jgi:hypothetical protein